jgi:hypothetical protein
VALSPLATGADLAERGITPDATSPVFLQVASDAVRDAAGCPISSYTCTIKLPGHWHGELELPAPVQSVSSVSIDDTVVTDYRLILNSLFRLYGWRNLGSYYPTLVSVTLTFGLLEVPADIVDLVCSLTAAGMAASQAGALAHDPRMTAEAIDDYRVNWASGPGAKATAMSIPDGTRDWLRGRFGTGITVTG